LPAESGEESGVTKEVPGVSAGMTNTPHQEDSMMTGKRIEESMTAHFSLKRAWAEFKDKDCVDSYHNALTLLQACKERMEAAGRRTA
jgi:hypothetical protein